MTGPMGSSKRLERLRHARPEELAPYRDFSTTYDRSRP